MKVTALYDTVVKVAPEYSQKLKDMEKFTLKKGVSLEVSYTRLSLAGHREIALVEPVRGRYNWFVYDPHIQVGEEGVSLEVPFYPQTDNVYEPERTCNTSACAMVAKYLGAPISGDDEYYAKYLKGDTTDHDAQTAALKRLGIDSRFYYNLDFTDLDKSLDRKRPVVIGILHRGTDWAPTGGHMVVVIGRTPGIEPDYYVHDPYGSIHDKYTGSVQKGKKVLYGRDLLRQRWTVPSPGTGWGRIFS